MILYKKKKINIQNILISTQFIKNNLIFKFNTNFKKQIRIEKYSFLKNSILKIVSYFFKKGFFLKYLITFLNIYNLLYSIFLNFDSAEIFKNHEYIYTLEFLYNLKYNKSLLNVNTLVYWFSSWNTPLFDLDVQKVPKKYKKKLKKKYTYKIIYLKKNKQNKKALQWVFLNSFNYEDIRTLKQQVLFNTLDTILNYKKSLISKKKILIYKKMFKK